VSYKIISKNVIHTLLEMRLGRYLHLYVVKAE